MRETIVAECDGSDYIHCCRYEQSFDYVEDNPCIWTEEGDTHKGGHFEVTIFTSKQFPVGTKVKITIETLEKKQND